MVLTFTIMNMASLIYWSPEVPISQLAHKIEA